MTIAAGTFADLYSNAYGFKRYGAAPTGDGITAAKEAVNRAYRLCLSANDWTFLSPHATITLWPAVAVAATATVACGTAPNTLVVTCTGATPFYPSMVGRTLTVTGIGTRTITGYTSSTVVTVDTTFATSHTFSIAAGDYGLPSGFSGLIAPFTYQSINTSASGLEDVGVDHVRIDRANSSGLTTDPYECGIEPRSFSTTIGQQYDLIVFPVPGTTRVLDYNYLLTPADMTTDGEYPVGGGNFYVALFDAVRMMAERESGAVNGDCASVFYGTRGQPGTLAQAIAADNRLRSPVIGELRQFGLRRPEHVIVQTTVTET